MIPFLPTRVSFLSCKLIEKKHLMIRILGRRLANHKVLYVQKIESYTTLFLNVKHLMICKPPTQNTNHKVLFFVQLARQK